MDHPKHQCRTELMGLALDAAQRIKADVPGGEGYAAVHLYCQTCGQSGLATCHSHDGSQAYMYANILAVTTLQVRQLGLESEVRDIMTRRMAELGIERKEG